MTSKVFIAQSLTHFYLCIVMFRFPMVQSWNIEVCWIDLVFVAKLSVVISWAHFYLFILMFKFAMVQPWNIGVCWIDLVFVAELPVVIFFSCSCRRLCIKTAFNLVKIHLLFLTMLLWFSEAQLFIFLSAMLLLFLGDWKIYPVCFPNICWHSGLKNQWKYV